MQWTVEYEFKINLTGREDQGLDIWKYYGAIHYTLIIIVDLLNINKRGGSTAKD